MNCADRLHQLDEGYSAEITFPWSAFEAGEPLPSLRHAAEFETWDIWY